MLKYLTKQFGLIALGLCILSGCIELRGMVREHDAPMRNLLKAATAHMLAENEYQQRINQLAAALPATALRSK